MMLTLRGGCLSLLFGLTLFVIAGIVPAQAQRPDPVVVMTVEGDSVYRLLPPDAIPAIQDPDFVTGEEADDQMSPEEPILGIVIGEEARAYSLWQLDSHEIVNDFIGGIPLAVTW